MRRVTFLALLLLAWPAGAAANDPVFGRWLVEDGRAVIEIEPCGSQACGRLVWMANPRDENGRAKRDDHNPDPSARARPLCGLTLVAGLQRAADGSWKGGQIYSARDGRTYGFQVAPAGPDALTARGYVGFSLLGGSQTWRREGGAYGSCTTLDGPGAGDR